jgi:hypothetical protein
MGGDVRQGAELSLASGPQDPEPSNPPPLFQSAPDTVFFKQGTHQTVNNYTAVCLS